MAYGDELRRLPALNVQDTPTSYGQRIGDQRAMTPRHERLGAHDRGHPFFAPRLEGPAARSESPSIVELLEIQRKR